VERAVRAVPVVVLDVLAQQLFEVSLIPDEGPVAELATHGADPAFRERVGDRRIRRGADDRGALAGEDCVERARELRGTVMDQESDPAVCRHGEVSRGLGRPSAVRVRCDAGEMHAAGVEFDEE
jgi:hypothetical protein